MGKHANPFRRGIIAPHAMSLKSRPLPAQGLKWSIMACIAQRKMDRAILRKDVSAYIVLTRLKGVCMSVGRDPVDCRSVFDKMLAL